MIRRNALLTWGLVALAGIATTAFIFGGEVFLSVNSDDGKLTADAIVVLAGASGEDNLRVIEGNKLYQQGRGRFVILPLRHPTFKWQWAVKNYHLVDPAPEQRVLIGRSGKKDRRLITDYGGTFLEALKTIKIMDKNGLNSAIVISSSYHMRRVRFAFNKAGSDRTLQFYYHPVANNKPAGKLWWTSPGYFKHIIREYKKLIAAYFIYEG